MKSNFSTIVISLLFLASCSGKPSASDIEESLSERITEESNGSLSLIEFEQTNAVENEVLDQATYTIQFKGKVRVEKDCFMYVNKSVMGSFFESFKTYENASEFIPSMMMTGVRCPKGEEIEFIDKVIYVETEERWMPVGKHNIY